MPTLTIEYPSEVLWALQQEPQEFEADVCLLLAVKLYETGRLSTGDWQPGWPACRVRPSFLNKT